MLVHGSMDRSAGFARVVGHLGDHHVVRYDRRGYGRSRDAGPPAGVAGHVDDLLDVITGHAGTGQAAVVVGHSYGGVVALGAAAARPDVVAAVGAFESPLPWLPWWPASSDGRGGDVADQEPADVAERFLRRMLGNERWEALPAATRRDRRREGPALVAEMTSVRQEPPFDLDAVEVPVVAGHGSRSGEHHRRGTQLLAERFGGTPFVIDGATHGAHLTHPAAFAAFTRTAMARAGP